MLYYEMLHYLKNGENTETQLKLLQLISVLFISILS